MLDKTYDPAEIERRVYERAEGAGAFAARPDSGGAPYTIMMPPPNVTGSLHKGHALNHTLQDVLTRYRRMQGRDALWQPGTDHAGIATQMVVERMLDAEGTSRAEIGRDAFLERAWAWKAESGGAITGQLRRLGASPDWARERFTLDEGLNKAVREAFVALHREGLIYRDKRLVNWDPKLLTAISDLECVPTEVDGQLWHFAYPIEGSEDETIVVATTRPETMLGDTAVAVHPDDERYAHLHGRHAILPLVGRRIPIVTDDYSDPEKGSGAVKITPAHDFNDFEVGKRHDLEAINIFDIHARINDNAPDAYRGLDRFEARKRVVAHMEAAGLLVKIEPNRHMVPHGDRSGVVIEPYLTDQWFCDAATLAQEAIAAVEDGRTRFVPKSYENTYFEWMRNIQPWCISRQLWWGHRIPAWYGPDGAIFVERSEAEAHAAAKAHYGEDVSLTRDADVLDTWFSSGLWPFSTIGWPDDTADLRTFYPTSCLVTGFDIIFFWVARMMMFGLYFKGDVPFKDVYIHGLVRDEHGQKMSKSKGNVVDPLDMVDAFGADALRFAILASTAQGRDVKFSEARVQGYRNFVTKLWNAARFCEMNDCRLDAGFDPAAARDPINRWIIGEAVQVTEAITAAIDSYRFNEAALAAYQFTWSRFCDWYLELAKPALYGEDEALKAETRASAAWALARLLKLLHPLMPFVTEALHERLFDAEHMLVNAHWPAADAALVDAATVEEIDWLIRLISGIRTARSELNIPAGSKLDLQVRDASARTLARLARHDEALKRLARLETVAGAEGAVAKGSVQVVIDEATYAAPLEGVIDLHAEQARLHKEMAKAEAEIGKIERKLANEAFIAKAPVSVVEEQRNRLALESQALDKLRAALARLT
ncbi:MAG: valine--tRNA ligase [Geminicoccaceae bacterium]